MTELSYVTGAVPPSMWGNDHFTTIVYAESCAVDAHGRINSARMRKVSSKYPTRLRDGVTLARHDDYDCLEDMRAFGFLEPTDDRDVVTLTPAGWGLAWALRQARALTGKFMIPAIHPALHAGRPDGGRDQADGVPTVGNEEASGVDPDAGQSPEEGTTERSSS
jgi:hypothetical protein